MSVIGKVLRGIGIGLGRGRASRKLRGIATPKPSLKSTYGAKTPRRKTKTTVPSTSVTYEPDLLPMNLLAHDVPMSQIGRAAKGLPMHAKKTDVQLFARELSKLSGTPYPGKGQRDFADYVERLTRNMLLEVNQTNPLHPRTWETFAGAAHDQSVSLRKFFNESARITGQAAPDSKHVTDMMERLARSHGKMSGPQDSLQNPFESMSYIVQRALDRQKRPEIRVPAMNKYYGPSFDAPSLPGPRTHLNTPPPSLKLETVFREAMVEHGGSPPEVTLIQFGKPVKSKRHTFQLSERLRSFKKQKAKTRAKKAAYIGGAAAAVYGSTRKGRE